MPLRMNRSHQNHFKWRFLFLRNEECSDIFSIKDIL